MLEAAHLSVRYGQHVALEDATLRVARGEIVVILGANGAGKTTLLKALSGISEGTVSGSVSLEGIELSGMRPDQIVEEGLALVPEGRGIFGDLKVEENLLLGAYSDRARDEEAGNLDQVYRLFPKLAERRRQVVRTMSGGEQQMVAIGRAMMSNPSILALDEPSLGLSPILCKELFRSLETVRDTGLGILLVEQNAKQSLAIADRGYLLENGRIVHEDEAAALRRDPAVQRAYLGGAAAAAAGHAPRGVPAQASAGSPGPAAAPPQPAVRRPAAGPSPAEIAAAAIARVEPERARDRVPAAAPPMRPAPPEPPHPAPPPGPAPAPAPRANGSGGTPGKDVHGIDVDSLVARAASTAERRAGPPRAVGPRPAPGPARPEAGRAAPPMPDLGASTADRLKAILTEIEQAARRAEGRRPGGGR